ncbi:hypothetical protein ACFOQM_06520 [Paenibacillus sp. GCM10012307]|uniref:Uncharacterized protein n=1 Tax=Paenibacillus roseus TaxID=2798579 RepID=A0A934MQ18_9BACL|nr:hypothetical protein [Paenibacillus roseus]MBJ6360954.1 hypothetical protein [Paenibacillus roseus]
MFTWPEARSNRWWTWTIWSALIQTGLLWGIRFGLAGQPFSPAIALRLLLLGSLLAAFYGLFGWLGAKWLWLGGTVGIAVGLVFMGYLTTGNSGWEDLISLMVFLLLVGAGLLSGLILEAVMGIIRIVKRK